MKTTELTFLEAVELAKETGGVIRRAKFGWNAGYIYSHKDKCLEHVNGDTVAQITGWDVDAKDWELITSEKKKNAAKFAS